MLTSLNYATNDAILHRGSFVPATDRGFAVYRVYRMNAIVAITGHKLRPIWVWLPYHVSAAVASAPYWSCFRLI